MLPNLNSSGREALQVHSTSAEPYDEPLFVQRMTSISYRPWADPPEHVNCGIADTRRAVVILSPRRVRDLMLDKSTALLGLLAAETCGGNVNATIERSSALIHEADIVSFMAVVCSACGDWRK